MGGLTAALAFARQGFAHIDVYELASNLGFVGAGIQLAPNMARILDQLGCWEEIEREAVDVQETSIRQGSSDEELAHVDLRYIRRDYDKPHMVGHRSTLAGGIYKACQRYAAIKFHFATALEDVLAWSPRPKLRFAPRNAARFDVEADVVLAADGVKSITRTRMLSALDASADIVDTGQAAYRIMLSRDVMAADASLLELVDSNAVTRWIGEKRHIIAYPVSGGQIYNLSTIQPDTHFAAAPSITYTTRGSKTDMLAVFADFCPRVQRMLNLVKEDEVCEWKLRVHAPLPAWSHGGVALMGDACHPTLPHLNQGAAQAIEDAACLAVVLAKTPSSAPEDLARALRVYEKLRRARATELVELAAASGRALHLGEGAAKEERDRKFRALKEGRGDGGVPDKWADRATQEGIYRHDVVAVAEGEFERVWAECGA
ncbi:uncharacterized protein K452DRAFT_15523 [Aplosporella prunicola CBS 121167]|uniref:FAD-binding domain-containing protein n=1 Tax=Aplosporella prunicola CBS 121167 TaxID=1176127 RepID=A0A6A6BGI3_9PEZI|nr:uncharacterized protein K452DRAFT_15523 [Aplosporella prunicola CBS 121167]KAF2143096.1 hypothetical protein K452DRAFT_15523 [Aplosporella prunicola CBS 121167]